MNVQKITITKRHLKSIGKKHIYDGIQRFSHPEENPELMRLTAMVLYEIYHDFVQEKEMPL